MDFNERPNHGRHYIDRFSDGASSIRFIEPSRDFFNLTASFQEKRTRCKIKFILEGGLVEVQKIIPKDKIELLEREILKQEQVDCPVVHGFGPGLYIREITIPAHTFVIGHEHKFDQMNFFLKGKLSILNDDGTVSVLTAPMAFVGKPGRKIAFSHEECVWTNVHSNPSNESDIEKLENYFVVKSDAWLESKEAKEQLNLFQVKLKKQEALCLT